VRRADKLYRLHVLIVLKSGSHNLLQRFGPVQACNGIALPFDFYHIHVLICGPGSSVGIATDLRAERSGDRIPVGARFSALGAHPASCTMGTGSFPGVKSGRDVTLTHHPLLVPWSRKGRATPLLPLWAVRPVQSHSACTRVTFTFYRLISR
jgi:hypothetical protein